jgi:acetyl esterase/lipase
LNEIVRSVEETFQMICTTYGPQQKFTLYGRSAGGHLALMLAARWPDRIEKVVSLYPVTDLCSLSENSNDQDILKTKTWLKDVVGGTLQEKYSYYQQLSPTENLQTRFPPTLLVQGVNDPIVTFQQSDLLFQKLGQTNASAVYLRFSKGTHGFDALWNGLSMNTFRKVLGAFLNK